MELFEHIRRDRREDGVSIRGLALRLRTLHVAPALSEAFADSVLAQVGQLQEINRQLEVLESKLAASLDPNPPIEA